MATIKLKKKKKNVPAWQTNVCNFKVFEFSRHMKLLDNVADKVDREVAFLPSQNVTFVGDILPPIVGN